MGDRRWDSTSVLVLICAVLVAIFKMQNAQFTSKICFHEFDNNYMKWDRGDDDCYFAKHIQFHLSSKLCSLVQSLNTPIKYFAKVLNSVAWFNLFAFSFSFSLILFAFRLDFVFLFMKSWALFSSFHLIIKLEKDREKIPFVARVL